MPKSQTPLRPPRYIWADFDPHAERCVRWAFYHTKAEQRDNRPDLQPIKLRIAGRAKKGTRL